MEDDVPELYLENQLCFPLYAASRLTTKLYTPFLQDLDVTYPQYLVLLALWQEDKQSVKAIGNRLYLESNTLTPLLKRLEKKQLIKRTRSLDDERTVVISLTTKGQQLKQRAKQIPGKIFAAYRNSTVTKKEIIAIQKTLFKLLSVIDKN